MIHIGDYGIDVSDKCYTVGKISNIKVKKDGKETGEEREYLINPSYATSFAFALKCVRKAMHREAIGNTDGDLNAAIEAIQKADTMFESLIKKIKADGVDDE